MKDSEVMSQLNPGDAVPLVPLQWKEMTLENAQGQNKETNVHDRTQTQGLDRLRREALGNEEVCTSLQWLTVTVPSLLGLDVFFCCWFLGHALSVSAPTAGTKSSTLTPLFTLSVLQRELHSSSGNAVTTMCCQGVLGNSGSQAEQTHICLMKLPAPEDGAALRQVTGSVVTENKTKLSAVGWSSLQPHFYHIQKAQLWLKQTVLLDSSWPWSRQEHAPLGANDLHRHRGKMCTSFVSLCHMRSCNIIWYLGVSKLLTEITVISRL